MKPKKPTCPACHGPATEGFMYGMVWCDAECDKKEEVAAATAIWDGAFVPAVYSPPAPRKMVMTNNTFRGIPPVPYASNAPKPLIGCRVGRSGVHLWQDFAHPTATDAEHCVHCGDVWVPKP